MTKEKTINLNEIPLNKRCPIHNYQDYMEAFYSEQKKKGDKKTKKEGLKNENNY